MQHAKGTRAAATNAREQQDNGGASYYTAPAQQTMAADQRHSMIQTAAYLRAEERGFQEGSPTQDWLDAEREVDARLGSRDRHTHATTN